MSFVAHSAHSSEVNPRTASLGGSQGPSGNASLGASSPTEASALMDLHNSHDPRTESMSPYEDGELNKRSHESCYGIH